MLFSHGGNLGSSCSVGCLPFACGDVLACSRAHPQSPYSRRRETFVVLLHCSEGRPSLQATTVAMAHRARGSTSGTRALAAARVSPLAAALEPLTERMDALELMFQDLHPQTVTRTLDRMHELEKVTREHCHQVLTITDNRMEVMSKALAEAESRCKTSLLQADEASLRLTNAASRHQLEATGLRQELGQLKEVMATKFDELEEDLTAKRETMQSFVSEQLARLEERVGASRERASGRQRVLQQRVDELTTAEPGSSGNGGHRGRTFLREQARLESESRSASAQSVKAHTSECHRVARMRSPRAIGPSDAANQLQGDRTQSFAPPPPYPGTAPLLAHHTQPAALFSQAGMVPWVQPNM